MAEAATATAEQCRSAAERRADAAARYRPDRVRLLIVAQTPPADLDRYFYFTSVPKADYLFRAVVAQVLGDEPNSLDKHDQLADLKRQGVFVIDLKPDPCDPAPVASFVEDLVARAVELGPDHAILVKVDVYDAAFEALLAAGVRVVDARLPFPSSSRQKAFAEGFGRALATAGFERLDQRSQPEAAPADEGDLDRLEGEAERAGRLRDEGRVGEALAVCDKLVAEYGDAETNPASQWIAYARGVRCECFRGLDDLEGLLLAGREMQGLYAAAEDPYVRAVATHWMVDAVYALMQAGRTADAIAVSQEYAAAFLREHDPEAAAIMAPSLLASAHRLTYSETPARLLLTILTLWTLALGEVAARVRPVHVPQAASDWLLAHSSAAVRRANLRAWGLGRERFRCAQEIFEEVARRFADAVDDSALQELLVRAEMGRAMALFVLGRVRAGVAAADGVAERGHRGVAAILYSAGSNTVVRFTSALAPALSSQPIPR